MRLIETLAAEAENAPRMFARALAREDLARLRKLQELAQAHEDLAAFKQRGLMVGWTQGDLRTLELKETLEPLLEAVHAFERGAGDEAALEAAWRAFYAQRFKVLVHCL